MRIINEQKHIEFGTFLEDTKLNLEKIRQSKFPTNYENDDPIDHIVNQQTDQNVDKSKIGPI